MIIAPSILSADFGHLQDEVEELNRSSAEWIHVDVMDGVFVPNISFGFPIMEPLRKTATKPLDVHLMITHPERYVERFCDAGAWSVGFHLEAAESAEQVRETLSLIRAKGVRTCLTVNPDIPAEGLVPFLAEVDMVLVMSVFAGFGGQKFIPDALDKVRFLRREIDSRGLPTLIEVDGGVNAQNAGLLRKAGADVLVAGSSVFKAPSKEEAILALKNA